MIKATNNFVFLIRDESEKEIGGLLIPDSGVKKTNKGKVISIGDLVQDKNIKKSKGETVIFHEGVGFSIEDEGVEYLVLRGEEIIGIK